MWRKVHMHDSHPRPPRVVALYACIDGFLK
jgi:hypothetical protein